VLIMGYGPRRPKDHGEVAPALCPHCGNHVVFRLLELRNWFSLFLVPLVPGRARHLVVCPVCQYGIELEPATLALAQELVELTARQRAGAVDPSEYRRKVDRFWSSLGGERLADTGDARPGGPPSPEPQRSHEGERSPAAESAPGPLDAPPPSPGSQVPNPPAGWYRDPFGEADERYWDGERWTAGTNPPSFTS
jgi:hypothetical protein